MKQEPPDFFFGVVPFFDFGQSEIVRMD